MNTAQEKYICVDVQGFATPHFIPKEMTLITGENVTHHFLFNAPSGGFPYKYRQSIEWLEDRHHGIPYSARGISFDGDIFRHFPAEVVYVKGQQKAEFMSRFYNRVVNLEYEEDSPKIVKTKDYCSYHNQMGYSWVCSNKNAYVLKYYIDENKVY